MAGVASIIITPTEPVWAGGYGGRTQAVSEKLQDLYAKALVLQDSGGNRVLIVTADILGFPRSLADPLREKLENQHHLRREQILLNASHTHCGPVLRESLVDIYPMNEKEWEAVRRYTGYLQERILKVVAEAMQRLRPVQLAETTGRCDFAVNRRTNREADVKPGYVAKGPVDHDVNVLRVTGADGQMLAVLFRYSCHNTTMNFYKWCGDYAGYAQEYIQQEHPEVSAMFAQGCGGDSNPLPRRKIELCQKYGRQLADAVDTVLHGEMRPLHGPIRAAYKTIELPLSDLPDRATLEKQANPADPKQRRAETALARRMLALLDAGKPLPDRYDAYPVQAIQIADLTIVSLGGEVVVDYCHRLQKELGRERTWVFGYCNDTMAYIPSRRVLAEGGYEGETSMPVYGLPGKWSPQIEDRVIAAVHDLVTQVRTP